MPDAAASARIAFALEHASKRYGAVLALDDDVSLAFAAGSTTALIGSSGSGKSAALRLLLGLEWPERGGVRVDGELLHSAPAFLAALHGLTGRIDANMMRRMNAPMQRSTWISCPG